MLARIIGRAGLAGRRHDLRQSPNYTADESGICDDLEPIFSEGFLLAIGLSNPRGRLCRLRRDSRSCWLAEEPVKTIAVLPDQSLPQRRVQDELLSFTIGKALGSNLIQAATVADDSRVTFHCEYDMLETRTIVGSSRLTVRIENSVWHHSRGGVHVFARA